jgi:hypothetical protein
MCRSFTKIKSPKNRPIPIKLAVPYIGEVYLIPIQPFLMNEGMYDGEGDFLLKRIAPMLLVEKK